MINRVASQIGSNGGEFTMMVTNANEVLALDGIHGKIASVGVGFGTGRHTALARLKKSLRGRKPES